MTGPSDRPRGPDGPDEPDGSDGRRRYARIAMWSLLVLVPTAVLAWAVVLLVRH